MSEARAMAAKDFILMLLMGGCMCMDMYLIYLEVETNRGRKGENKARRDTNLCKEQGAYLFQFNPNVSRLPPLKK
jgi:hypothetical protein